MDEKYVLKEFFRRAYDDKEEPVTIRSFVADFGDSDDEGYEKICKEFDMDASLGTTSVCTDPALATKVSNFMAAIHFGCADEHTEQLNDCQHYAVVEVELV
jgi:hypothetical protein